MRATSMTALAFALVVACSSRPPAVEPPATHPITPEASAHDAGASARDAQANVAITPTRPPREVKEPADAACRIPSPAWRSRRLRLRVDGPVFAEADRVRTTLALPTTATPSEAIAVMDDGRIVLRAVIARGEVEIFAPKPTAFLGVVTPLSRTTLDWRSATPGKIGIELDTSNVLRSPKPFLVDVPCADVALVATTYDARGSVTKRTNLPKRDVIRAGAPLAAAPGSTSVAELESGVEVEVIETRSGQAHVLVETMSYVLSGWVAQKDLGPAGLHGMGVGTALGGERAFKILQLLQMHCPTDIDLFVDRDGETVKVGIIHKDAGFQPRAPSADDPGPYRLIDVPESQWLSLEKNVRLAVMASDLTGCKQATRGF